MHDRYNQGETESIDQWLGPESINWNISQTATESIPNKTNHGSSKPIDSQLLIPGLGKEPLVQEQEEYITSKSNAQTPRLIKKDSSPRKPDHYRGRDRGLTETNKALSP